MTKYNLDLSEAFASRPKINRLPLIMNQKRIWIDIMGKEHIVNFMSIDYVKNLRRWLLRRAYYIHERYIMVYFLGYNQNYMGDAASDAFEDAFNEAMDENPKTWLKHQPLYRALLKREWNHRRKVRND